MEFKITTIPKIEPIRFNYEELKNELEIRVEEYKTVAYTADTIRQAKADRASLNALKKSLNDERIRLEREYMEPFRDFKEKVTELVGIVDEGAKAIDVQVKEYEELQKQKKGDTISGLYDEILREKYPWMDPRAVWNERWLNASYTIKQIRADLEGWDQKITNDLEMLSRLPEYAFEAQETYKRTLKVEDAMWTADNLKQMAEEKKRREEAKKKAEEAAATAPQMDEGLPGQMQMEEFMPKPVEEESVASEDPVQVLRFQCYCTMEQAMALRNFMVTNGIKFERA